MRTLEDMTEEARIESAKLCEDFPHLVCSETKGLQFKDWCGPCLAKAWMKLAPTLINGAEYDEKRKKLDGIKHKIIDR